MATTNTEIAKRLGPILREAMTHAGYRTQTALAAVVGCQPAEISRYLKGETMPDLPRLVALCEVLKLPVIHTIARVLDAQDK